MKKGELIAQQGEEGTDDYVELRACSDRCVFLGNGQVGAIAPFHLYAGGGPPWYPDSVAVAKLYELNPQGQCSQFSSNGAGGNPGWCMTKKTEVSL